MDKILLDIGSTDLNMVLGVRTWGYGFVRVLGECILYIGR